MNRTDQWARGLNTRPNIRKISHDFFFAKQDGKIEYFEERLPQWILDPAAIGLTPDQIAALTALVADARANYTAVQLGKQDLKNLVNT